MGSGKRLDDRMTLTQITKVIGLLNQAEMDLSILSDLKVAEALRRVRLARSALILFESELNGEDVSFRLKEVLG